VIFFFLYITLLKHLETIAWLEQRLQQPLPGFEAQRRMIGRVLPTPASIPENARLSAVLGLLFPVKDDLRVLLIRRTEDGHAHSGQISFPGGRKDEEDETLLHTALREAREEVGIDTNEIKVLGQLSSTYIPVSNFHVFPFLAFAKEKPITIPNSLEVAYTIEVSLNDFLKEDFKTKTTVTSSADKSFIREVNAYRLHDGGIIWGATAMIISELEVIYAEYV
jgi:8-oxo-dGTP pyrophosphatase MutT (NUDIX family)